MGRDLPSTIKKINDSRKKIKNGVPDWYGVLGLKKSATFEKIHKKYYKLRYAVEAGINKVFGVEEALQILSEALCEVTQTFWTKCSSCHFHFQYENIGINQQLVCVNCQHLFVAVPLTYGNHPMYQRTMSDFSLSHEDRSVVLALRANSSDPKGEASESEMKKILMQKARSEILKQLGR